MSLLSLLFTSSEILQVINKTMMMIIIIITIMKIIEINYEAKEFQGNHINNLK